MIRHLRSSSDHIDKFLFDSIYSLTVKKSIYLILLLIVRLKHYQSLLWSRLITHCTTMHC